MGAMPSLSLKTKLTLLAVLPATLIAGSLGGWLAWRSYASLREQALAAQLALARTLASQADQGISQAFAEVLFLAKVPAVVNLDKPGSEQVLSLVAEADELLDSVLMVLPSGKIKAQSMPPAERGILPPASLYRENLEGLRDAKESVITDLYLTKAGSAAQAISAPIFRGNKLRGTLVGVMHLPNRLVETLQNGRLGKNSSVVLVNEEGVILAHPDPSRVFNDFSKNPAVAAALKEKDGIIEFQRPSDGVAMLASFARVESATWSVVLSQPLADAYEPAQRMLPWLILYLLITLFAVALLGGSLASRVAGPILDLTEKVRLQDLGRLASLSGRERDDEVGLLSKAISRLAKDLGAEREERERAHKRALQAERQLSEKERLASIGQLAAGLAHELNNPLTVIQGAAEVAQAGRGAGLKRWMEAIQKETKRCKNLVRDLLDFARPLKLRLKRADLVAVAREAWDQSGMGRPQGPRAELSMPARKVLARVDAERLKQVFINLFSNAREAGAARVGVNFGAEGNVIKIEVGDDGPGLGREPEKYFRPFFTTRASGTGLGLSIARMILQAHGGRLWAERQPKGARGSRFVMELPKGIKHEPEA
jgi:signal transduction histidine kinase